ncbi:hypothetical protein [Hymenobacter canadensis]|uniref:Uncharacterized protein n=1 Tax=Hymenobacter canadensis TaxID=2999067 RepID=A0ABY7LXZ6_9BACT|nr:hypothetical protein [Hymenobacter canadensis]WBA44386.1 hypothetical protein O3303_21785 [Hymenobacter canadensis]
MNQRTTGLLLLFLLLPTWAFAHGEEVLTTVFLLAGSLLLFLVGVLAVPVPYAEKAVLVAVYLVTLAVATYWANGLPYRMNIALANWVIGLAPFLTTVSAALLMWARRKKPNVQE